MKSIKYCLNKQLAEIAQRSLQLEELSLKVAQFLPQELAPHCHVGSFNKGCLLITTNNAVWASQLRYAIPELRDKLRKEAGMYQLSSIKVDIGDTVALPQSTIKKTPPHVLSDSAKATLLSESEHCSYQPLKSALLHLARNDEDDK